MSSRRTALANVRRTSTTNASLWLDKYIPSQARGDASNRSQFVKEVSKIETPRDYKKWYERWVQTLQEYGAQGREAESLGRVAIGLGSESVIETSITLHHTFGVPFIPGSALKGLTATYAKQYLGPEWEEHSFAYKTLFGELSKRGRVQFFDALPVPNQSKVLPDIITVHHGKYYQNEGVPPADWDEPTPVPFLSAQGSFLVALAGPAEWVEAAFDILSLALFDLGIGAKTSSGYGRMLLKEPPDDPNEIQVNLLIQAVNALSKDRVPGAIHAHYETWRDCELPTEYKVKFAQAIVNKADSTKNRNIKKKAWYKELKHYLREHV